MKFLKSPLAASLVYLATVYAIVIFGSPDGWKVAVDRTLGHPDSAIWCILLAFQVTAWTFAIGPAYRRAFSAGAREHWREVVVDIVVLLSLCALLVVNRYKSIAAGTEIVDLQPWKTGVVTVFGALMILPCLIGIRLISFSAPIAARDEDPLAALKRLETLHADLRWFVLVASAVIGGATLTRGALHNAITAVSGPGASSVSGILLYAGFCSGVVAVFYIPAYVSFAGAARTVTDRLFAEPAADAAEWLKNRDQRSKLQASLGLDLSVTGLLGDFGAVMAPFMTSAVAFLVKFK
jgi:hypothetical protein